MFAIRLLSHSLLSLSLGLPVSAPLPEPSNPSDAVRALAAAYDSRSFAAFRSRFVSDYRFTGLADENGTEVVELDLAGELRVAAHLFDVPVEGEPIAADLVPVAIHCVAQGLHEAADPEHPDSTDHYRLVIADRFTIRIETRGGEVLEASPLRQVFALVRGDAAVLGAYGCGDPGSWYVRRWVENVDRITAALARTDGRVEPAPADLDRARPAALAIRPLGNPARPSLDLVVELPGAGPAQLEVFDVLGRRLARRDLSMNRAGAFTVRAGDGLALAPGAFWVRVTQEGFRPVTRRVFVAR